MYLSFVNMYLLHCRRRRVLSKYGYNRDRGLGDLLGQSDGGIAVLGLITQTNRFRSAIASASFGNFVSL
jgi:hypothetical protein